MLLFVGNNPSQIGPLLEIWAFGSIPVRKGETAELPRKSHPGRQVLSSQEV
jgi:hypothetical protein